MLYDRSSKWKTLKIAILRKLYSSEICMYTVRSLTIYLKFLFVVRTIFSLHFYTTHKECLKDTWCSELELSFTLKHFQSDTQTWG